jgi:hypothetical protein
MSVTSYQDGGTVILGSDPVVTITKVTGVEVQVGGAVEYSDVTRSGDTRGQSNRGLPSDAEISVTINVYDEAGIASGNVAKTVLKNDDFSNITITERPEGTGTDLPTRTFTGMTLETKSTNYQAGRSRPPTAVALTFTGRMSEEPAWAEQ